MKDMKKQIEHLSWVMATNDLRSLGVFLGILEALQANGADLCIDELNSFVSQLKELKEEFQEILDREEEKNDN